MPEHRVALALRIWLEFLAIRLRFGHPLPVLVAQLSDPSSSARVEDPARLSAGIFQVLRIGRRRPSCLLGSLVLFRLLRRQGAPAELVIGLPAEPASRNAHAWVELDGRVVGPPPGSLGRVPLARYP